MSSEKSTSPAFHQALGLKDGVLLVAGSMIGSGIFIVSADILRNVGNAYWLIFVWLITGVMTLFAALSYGELSGMFPKAGGQYTYLKEAYNPLVAFVYGWSMFSVIQTGTIAAVAVAFAKFTAYIVQGFEEGNVLLDLGFLKINAGQLLAIASILFLTFINTRGVEHGKRIQLVFTSAKVIALAGLVLAGFFLVKESFWSANWSQGMELMQNKGVRNSAGILESAEWLPISGMAVMGAIAAAMVGSIFSSDAWNNVTFIAGEIKNPAKNIGLSLIIGTAIVTGIYILINLMYLNVLPINDLAFAKNERIGVTVAQQIFPSTGTTLVALLIMVATFGCNNGLILAGARIFYTMAKDNLFFKPAGELNRAGVPAWSLWAQAIVASILCLSGRYGDLLDMICFVVVLFYVITIVGIFVLRKKAPDHPRPYKALGFPIVPIIYIIMGVSFCLLLIIYKPQYSWPGLIIACLGIPIYYVVKQRRK